MFNCHSIFFTLSCFSSDPDPLQDFCVADLNATTVLNGFPCKPVYQVTSDDFLYSGLVNEASTVNPMGVAATFADVKNFPGLNTLGLSMARGELAPSAYFPVHVHPRATELNFVMKGELLFGFISTSNVLYSKVVKAGELFVVPRGLVHFVKNNGPGKAVVVAAFNSQLAGVALIPNNLFASNPTIPNDILAQNFQVDENVIVTIKSKFAN
ncbi:germin-like protein subfamily T member 1 [Papaver somniferum]|uniref:germin-like protein subfamily T member 1 n=1 Tax=Papaver somniferum TaxID=3469 RepID=UPI000E700C3D|nr:germin-like protein subfamily T member 1 [Papaver somniferum]